MTSSWRVSLRKRDFAPLVLVIHWNSLKLSLTYIVSVTNFLRTDCVRTCRHVVSPYTGKSRPVPNHHVRTHSSLEKGCC